MAVCGKDEQEEARGQAPRQAVVMCLTCGLCVFAFWPLFAGAHFLTRQICRPKIVHLGVHTYKPGTVARVGSVQAGLHKKESSHSGTGAAPVTDGDSPSPRDSGHESTETGQAKFGMAHSRTEEASRARKKQYWYVFFLLAAWSQWSVCWRWVCGAECRYGSIAQVSLTIV